MSRDKQIEEMARKMCFQRESCTVKSCVDVNCEKTWLVENLYNAGYRKASEVAREIFEEIEKTLLEYHRDKSNEYMSMRIKSTKALQIATAHYQGLSGAVTFALLTIAELKKKYTEGEG